MNIVELCNDIEKEIKKGNNPPTNVLVLLHINFEALTKSLQNLLLDKGLIRKQRCEVWSRVMGYFRPVNQWNKGKQQEHADRKHYFIK